jgi:DNA-binding CsgD family transcriptional regulator
MRKEAETTAKAFVNMFPAGTNEKTQLEQFKAESNDDIIFAQLRFAETIFADGAIMLCPVSHAKSRYMSINCERIFGHTHEALMKMNVTEFFGLVHPDDIQPVRQCFEFIKGLEPYDPALHRFTIRYRVRNSQGEYNHLENQNLALNTSLTSYLYLMLFSNINDEKFYQVTLDVYKKVKGNYIKSYTYNPRQKETAITPRQNDIAKLILKGFTNQEIADLLNVSVFTVKNHKKTLFRKVNVKNSLELANYVRQA